MSDEFAVDEDGKRLALTAEQVRQHIRDMVDDPESDILLIAMVNKVTHQIAVPVFGPPSAATEELLHTVWMGYRRARLEAEKQARKGERRGFVVMGGARSEES